MNKRIISLFLCMLLIFTSVNTFNIALADEQQNSVSNEEKRAEIKKKLDDIDKQLAQFDSESKETEEYIKVLDEKISYLNEQFKIAKEESERIERKVENLEKNISSNEKEISVIQDDVTLLEGDMAVLSEQFSSTYESYCSRIRAIYESGTAGSTLPFLFESNGVQNILTRLEMIRVISKRDGQLLEEVKEQTDRIVTTKEELDKRRSTLTTAQDKLKKDEDSLKTERANLLKKQDEMAIQQAEIEKQQLDANALLKKLNDKTKEYGEYRDITQAELDEIDAAIEEADKRYPDPQETTTETTTKKKKKKTTTTTTSKSETTSRKQKTTTTTTQPTTTTTTTAAGQYLSLTYPCPAYTRITCAFGAYAGHTGCDFSTNGNENQRIVAADSGTVILVRLLERSYGHYIVIRHDKKTRSGKTVYTLYAHNNDIIVSEGEYVTKGQKIANSGTTGNSTGPHCHFEVRVGGSSQSYAVDPELYLP